jgi:nucleotide-binding universal stress UspA family protein
MDDATGHRADSGPFLLCFDGSDCAAAAIRVAGELCGGGTALVAHAWLRPSAVMFQGRRVEGSHPLAEAAEEFDASTREGAEERAAEGVRVAREAGFDAEPLLVEHAHGTWRPLVELAIERRARAVVVGSHGLSPVKSALLGSVSRGIANHCPRPVIVVPSIEAREQ